MQLKTPVIIINLKKYDEVLGKNSLKFSRMARKLMRKYKNMTLLIAPPFPFLNESAKITPTLSQHIDPLEPGAFTGTVIAKEIKEIGVVGSIINHSERRIPYEDIGKCVELCRKYDLASFVCVKDNNEARELAKFKPDFIAVEPPELIGGNVCVSDAKPDIIRDSVKAVKEVSPSTHVLCGAGVKHTEDVKKVIQMGTSGVILASGVAKSKNIRKAMEELIMGTL
jgi:triosephosphate isomerase (TIM)